MFAKKGLLRHNVKSERIIDAHTHIFPGKIAQKAVHSIGDFYHRKMHDGNGTAASLLKSGHEIGVEQYVVCSAATTPEQVPAINDFIWKESAEHPEFIPFATMHPGVTDIEREMQSVLDRGYRGIKLHPDFQRFNIDDDRALPIYEMARGKLCILFHTGDAWSDYSSPRRLEAIAERFPDLICIAAHFGGYSCWKESFHIYHAPNIYMDTSSSLFQLPTEGALEFFARFGTDRFFFGTDFPMWTHSYEMKRFDALGLSPEDRKKILRDNFARVVLGESGEAAAK